MHLFSSSEEDNTSVTCNLISFRIANLESSVSLILQSQAHFFFIYLLFSAYQSLCQGTLIIRLTVCQNQTSR